MARAFGRDRSVWFARAGGICEGLGRGVILCEFGVFIQGASEFGSDLEPILEGVIGIEVEGFWAQCCTPVSPVFDG